MLTNSIVHKVLATNEGSKNDGRKHFQMASKTEIKNTFRTVKNVLQRRVKQSRWVLRSIWKIVWTFTKDQNLKKIKLLKTSILLATTIIRPSFTTKWILKNKTHQQTQITSNSVEISFFIRAGLLGSRF